MRILVIALSLGILRGCARDSSDIEYGHEIKGEAHSTGMLKNGKKHGVWTTVENGTIAEIAHWRDGLRHGPTRSWYLEDMYDDVMYQNGEFHGRTRTFYHLGQISELSWYFRNQRDGTWCKWDLDGSLEYIRVYYRDKPVSSDENPPGECPLVLDEPRHLDPDDQDYSF